MICLIPRAGENGKKTRFRSGKEAAMYGKKGGEASGRSRRMLKSFKQADEEVVTDDDIREILSGVVALAKKRNLHAVKLYMEMVGMNNQGEQTEQVDDGFIEALNGSAANDWSDGDDSDGI